MPYSAQGQIYPSTPQIQLPPYERPSDWLPLPEVSVNEEKFVGLFAVFNVSGNFVAIQFEGDYTVDWGDGTVENIASGVKAEHSYSYSAINPATECSRGYRQVIVTVTPQVGQNLTYLSISKQHSNVSESYGVSPWLDIAISMPNADYGLSILIQDEDYPDQLEICSIVAIGNATDFGGLFDYCIGLQKVSIADLGYVENISEMFYNCFSLKSVSLPSALSVTSLTQAFEAIGSLQYVTLGDLPMVEEFNCYDQISSQGNVSLSSSMTGNLPLETSLSYSFKGNSSLENMTLSALPNLDHLYGTFEDCYSIKQLYIPDTPSLYYVDEPFRNNYCLQQVTFESLPSLYNLSSLFTASFSETFGTLYKLNFPETPSLEYGYNIFGNDCGSLQEFSLASAPLLTDLPGLGYCPAAQVISYPELPSLTSADFSFGGTSATSIDLNAPLLESIYYAFANCESLKSITIQDASNITDTAGSTENSPTISAISMPGLAVDFFPSNCLLSREAIVSLFNDLGTASATIDVSGNYGAAELTGPDIAIATGKGWTVLT